MASSIEQGGSWLVWTSRWSRFLSEKHNKCEEMNLQTKPTQNEYWGKCFGRKKVLSENLPDRADNPLSIVCRGDGLQIHWRFALLAVQHCSQKLKQSKVTHLLRVCKFQRRGNDVSSPCCAPNTKPTNMLLGVYRLLSRGDACLRQWVKGTEVLLHMANMMHDV